MKSIDIIMIPVTDRQKAKAFYLQLGYEIVTEAQDPHGEAWIQMKLPESTTTISLASFSAIICDTANIEQSIADYKALGIHVGNVDVTPWGKFAWLKDPDGNSICLREK